MTATGLLLILLSFLAFRATSFVPSNCPFASRKSQWRTDFGTQQSQNQPRVTRIKALSDLDFLNDDDEDSNAAKRRILKTLEILKEIKMAKTVKDWVNILFFLESLRDGGLKKEDAVPLDENILKKEVKAIPIVDEAIKLLEEVQVNPPTIGYAKYPNHREVRVCRERTG